MRYNMNKTRYNVHGAGIGLRRSMIASLLDQPPSQVGFMEVAPENWIGIGGIMAKQFRTLAERYDMICHGLSLSIGSPSPLDEAFLQRLKRFLDEHDIKIYSEHLSYCSDDGHLYDLLPIPFTEEAIHYVSKRIKRVQDILERPVAMENVSYYAAPGQQMPEIEFLNAVLQEADCKLLLDVNNIYVNSINHQYNAADFLHAIPKDRIEYIHIAGHYEEAADLMVDTHGADVIQPVWDLLEQTYKQYGVLPTLLERDFNIPPLAELLKEVDQIITLQHQYQSADNKIKPAKQAL